MQFFQQNYKTLLSLDLHKIYIIGSTKHHFATSGAQYILCKHSNITATMFFILKLNLISLEKLWRSFLSGIVVWCNSISLNLPHQFWTWNILMMFMFDGKLNCIEKMEIADQKHKKNKDFIWQSGTKSSRFLLVNIKLIYRFFVGDPIRYSEKKNLQHCWRPIQSTWYFFLKPIFLEWLEYIYKSGHIETYNQHYMSWRIKALQW